MPSYYSEYISCIRLDETFRKKPGDWLKRSSYYSAFSHFISDPITPSNSAVNPAVNPALISSGISSVNSVDKMGQLLDDLFGKSNFITISYDVPGCPQSTAFESINQMTESILSHLGLGQQPKTPIAPKPEPVLLPELPFKAFETTPKNIADLIRLGEQYDDLKAMNVRFPLDIERLRKLVTPLKDLSSMIGMTKAKEAVFNQIIYQLQGLRNPKGDFLHTIIDGEPGVGKTDLARILGRIFAAMGAVSKGTFTEINITDLKGAYVGQSEMKTTKKLNEALGGVVYFDEAYSLGSSHIGGGVAGMDTYSEGIINIINRYMSEHVDDLIMIFSGYKTDMTEKFFSGNRGLQSRIGIWISIDTYKAEDLAAIFTKKVSDNGWKCDVTSTNLSDFFTEHREMFKYNGRDIEIFLTQVKTAHARRMLDADPSQHRIISPDDLRTGMEYWRHLRQQDSKSPIPHIYI